MEDYEEFEIVDNKKDEVVIYRDKDDLGRVFVTKPILDKFNIEMPYYKLRLDNDEELYEIKPQEAIYIIEHADNKYAPYDIRYQNFDFNNELEDETQETIRRQMEEPMEVIKIYRDIDNSERAFVTKDVMMRFHLTDDHHKVLLGDFIVYEIDPTEAINIINNSMNKYAPYGIEYVGIEFDNGKKETKEPVMPYEEKEVVMPYHEKEVVMPYEEKVMPYEEKKKVETKVSAGPRPRLRREDESEEVYVAYLEGFYDCFFGVKHDKEEERRKKKEQKPVILKNPVERSSYDSDKEYLAYLKSHYSKIYNDKMLESVKAKNVIKERPKRQDETDEEYNAYLSMFYGTQEQEDVNTKTK